MNELEKVGRKLWLARNAQKIATETARVAALAALNDGATEVDVAKALGVDRMTIRKWAGKRT